MKAFRASGISGVCYDDRRASIYLEINLLYLKRRLFGGVITVYPTVMEQDSTLSLTQHLPQSASAVSAQCLTVTQDFRDADGRWYVMLSANPKGTEMELAHENARRVQENQPMLLAFSPYLFLTQGIDTEMRSSLLRPSRLITPPAGLLWWELCAASSSSRAAESN